MVNNVEALDAAFAALADPTRRAILARLAQGEAGASDLAQPFAMSLPAVLKHLDLLERAGLLQARKEGRVRRCRLNPEPLDLAAAWIARQRKFWEERFDALDLYLRNEENDRWSQPKRVPPDLSGSRASSRRRATKSSAPSRRRRR